MIINSFPHYKQQYENDCGATCLKIISKYFGKTFEIEYIHKLCKFQKKGTSIADLTIAAEHLGFKSMVFDVSLNQLASKAILPCIAFLDNRHFAIIFKTTKRYIYVSDPENNKRKYTYDEFKLKFYCNSDILGAIICLEPQPSFYNRNSTGKEIDTRMSYLRVTIQYLEQYKVQLLQLTVIMAIITLLQGATPFIFRSVLDIGVDKKNLDFINMMLVTNIIMMLSTVFANLIRDYIISHIGIRFSISIISNYLIQLLSMPLSFFHSLSSGEMLNKVKENEKLKNFVLYHFTNFTYSILSFLIFGIILYIFSLSIFLIYFSGTFIYIIWILCFKRYQENLEQSSYNLHNKNNNFWIETIHNIADIKSYNYEYIHRKKWEEIQVSLYHKDISSAKIRNIQDGGSQIINGIKSILITFFCAKSVVYGEMTFGIFISVQFMVGFLNSPIHQLISFIQLYPSAKQGFSRLNEIHNRNGHYTPDYDKLVVNSGRQDINFKKIYFKYWEGSNYCLKNLTFSIPYGKMTALIGKSGSGKSSIIKLIVGLYQPSDGELLIGDTALNNVNIENWRNRCAIVLQDGKIFHDTILNNIILDDLKLDQFKLENIIKMLELKEILNELPQGYHTMIGEKGRNLSQGQKQKILLARALYKEPEFLFLDEATSGLDTLNETVILNRVIEFMRGKTLLIATHRINTIHEADQILVINDGLIIESGTHENLLTKNGIYAVLNNLQQDKRVPSKD